MARAAMATPSPKRPRRPEQPTRRWRARGCAGSGSRWCFVTLVAVVFIAISVLQIIPRRLRGLGAPSATRQALDSPARICAEGVRRLRRVARPRERPLPAAPDSTSALQPEWNDAPTVEQACARSPRALDAWAACCGCARPSSSSHGAAGTGRSRTWPPCSVRWRRTCRPTCAKKGHPMSEPAAPAATHAPAAPPPTPRPTFDVLALGADVRRAIDAMGYKHPTPVQTAVYEPGVRGQEPRRAGPDRHRARRPRSVCRSSTRSCAPRSSRCRPSSCAPRASWRCRSSRELEQIGQFRGTQVTAIYGGAPIGKQIEALQAGAQMVVGTPGPRARPPAPEDPRSLGHQDAHPRRGRRDALDGLRPRAQRHHRDAAQEPPGSVLQRDDPAGHRAPRALAAAQDRSSSRSRATRSARSRSRTTSTCSSAATSSASS